MASDDTDISKKALPPDCRFSIRKCANCGQVKMAPEATFTGSDIVGAAEKGLVYRCPDCDSTARIYDSGAIFMGVIYSGFWLLVAYWAFLKGPWWYIRHARYLFDDFHFGFFLVDVFLIVLGLTVVAFSFWITWTFLAFPALTLLRHPAVDKNRPETKAEATTNRRSRRNAVLSFLVLPLLFWVPLIGISFGLETAGINARDFEALVYIAIALGFGGVVVIAGKMGVNAAYSVVGLVFWLALIVTAIFTLR